jgi:predicted solute-binding protein
MLARVILAEKYGCEPRLISRPADLAPMLGEADAALLIGDAALRLDLAALPFETLDLGGEWVVMTGLPMVFAVWSGRKQVMEDRYARAFAGSCLYGLQHMDDIVQAEAPRRQVSEELARQYLTRRIVFELGERDYLGMKLYLKQALRLDRTAIPLAGGTSA